MDIQKNYKIIDKDTFEFESEIWIWDTIKGSWHFVSLPLDLSSEIKKQYNYLKAGWSSLKVEVKIKNSHWNTSLFWDSKSKSYILPIKAQIRKAQNLVKGDKTTLQIKVMFAL